MVIVNGLRLGSQDDWTIRSSHRRNAEICDEIQTLVRWRMMHVYRNNYCNTVMKINLH